MYNSSRSHHTAEGFRNNYRTGPPPSFWKWQRERWQKGLPRIPEGGYHFEVLKPDVAWIKANRTEPTITWIGHATFLLQLNGVNMLTDAQSLTVLESQPWLWIPPGIMIALAVLSINFIGDGLRDALDPYLLR